MAASVNIVEFRLGHRVVDVDGLKEQFAFLLHLDEPMDTGRSFLGNADHRFRNTRPMTSLLRMKPDKEVLDDLFLLAT